MAFMPFEIIDRAVCSGVSFNIKGPLCGIRFILNNNFFGAYFELAIPGISKSLCARYCLGILDNMYTGKRNRVLLFPLLFDGSFNSLLFVLQLGYLWGLIFRIREKCEIWTVA